MNVLKKRQALTALVVNALLAAMYVALTFTVSALSFGMLQFRLSEAMTVLPLFYPPAVIGLGVGCFLSNLIGFLTALNPIGLIDCVVGTTATVLAALCTAYIGKRIKRTTPRILLGLVPPVLLNALIIGAELTVLFLDAFYLNFFWVGLGQLVVCYALGAPLGFALARDDLAKRIFKT